MRNFRAGIVALALLGVGVARAQTTFSEIDVSGSLALPNLVDTSGDGIDVHLENATVGDPAGPVRAGTVVISYEATRAGIDRVDTTLLGALTGAASVSVAMLIEDLDVMPPVTIGEYAAELTANDDFPATASVMLSRITPHIRVTKTLTFSSPTTEGEEWANVSLSGERMALVPEPAGLALAGVLVLALRRRL
ncbi:MAG: hypothetical protein AB7Q17_13020 [Phycisphaerae bacterium]